MFAVFTFLMLLPVWVALMWDQPVAAIAAGVGGVIMAIMYVGDQINDTLRRK